MPYGVTPQMIDAFGDMIFDLSLNIQVRRGDPIRNLDVDAWHAQRDATGLTDPEIAARIGLAVPQVTFIRCATERRKFRLNQYRKLYRLGGGLRHREDRYQDPEEPFEMRPDAVMLRRSIRFDAAQVRKFVEGGWWNSDTIQECLNRAQATDTAIQDESGDLTYAELIGQAKLMALGLRRLDIGKGDVVATCLPELDRNFVITYLAIQTLGGVCLPLNPSMPGRDIAAILRHARARGVNCSKTKDNPALAQELKGLGDIIVLDSEELSNGQSDDLAPRLHLPVAADPILLLLSAYQDGQPKLAPFTQQNLLSNAALLAKSIGIASDDAIASNSPMFGLHGLLALHLALYSGATLSLSEKASLTVSAEMDGTGTITGSDSRKIDFWGSSDCQILLVDNLPIEGSEVRIVAQDGALLALGEEGQLQVRSPSLSAGFFDNDAANGAAYTADSWYRTGRQATIARDGTVQLTD